MEIVDITRPSVMGFAITPWFIIFCLCFVGLIVSAIFVVSAFSKKDARERKMIKNAANNTSRIPIKTIDIQTIDFSDKDAIHTEAMNINLEKTEGLENNKELEKTNGLNFETEGLDNISSTEAFSDINKTESFDNKDMTEGLIKENNVTEVKRAKFCSKCGNKVSGKYCSHCGQQIIQ